MAGQFFEVELKSNPTTSRFVVNLDKVVAVELHEEANTATLWLTHEAMPPGLDEPQDWVTVELTDKLLKRLLA